MVSLHQILLRKREQWGGGIHGEVFTISSWIEQARKDGTRVVMNSKSEHFGPQTVRGAYGTDWDEDM